jgi:hypothetical protein
MALVLASTVVVVVVAGCAADSGRQAGPQPSEPVTTTGTPASCGQVPSSTGPAAHLVTVRVIAPDEAASGATIAVQSTADVRADGPRIITVPAASRLLVTREGTVVGMSDPAPGPAAIPLILTAGVSRPLQAVPDSVALVGCRHPDGSPGAPLPPGAYAVVPVLAYGQDPLQNAADGSAKSFTLVGQPAFLTVS